MDAALGSRTQDVIARRQKKSDDESSERVAHATRRTGLEPGDETGAVEELKLSFGPQVGHLRINLLSLQHPILREQNLIDRCELAHLGT